MAVILRIGHCRPCFRKTANGAFEDTEEEATEIIEEFFPPLREEWPSDDSKPEQALPSLTHKLKSKAKTLAEPAVQ